eukprot:gene20074-20611_t
MWVQTGGPPGKPVVIYDYDPSRSGEVPVRLLHDYRGYLMTDGYDGYNKLARTEGIERLACFAHVRRRFVDAARVQPKGKRGRADEAVAMIGKLYRIEREHKDTADAARLLARQLLSVPVLVELHAWMVRMLPVVTPKSALGTALSYMRDLPAAKTVEDVEALLPWNVNSAQDVSQAAPIPAASIGEEQPNMFGSFLVQKQMGVSFEKMEFLLEILLICFQAMKESGLTWPLITEDEQDKQLARYVATVKFGEDLSSSLQDLAMKQYIENHPEQYLLAFVTVETKDWLSRIALEKTDNYVMLAAANFVNCIAFVPMHH